MPTSDSQASNNQLEFLKLKVFLYKYTPIFEVLPVVEKGLQQIDPYKIDLDPTFFSKFDITRYVSGYTFNQDLTANTYNWSVSLRDAIITAEEFDTDIRIEGLNPLRKVPPPANRNLTPTNASTLDLARIATYEADDPGFSEQNGQLVRRSSDRLQDITTIRLSKLRRGHAENNLTEKASNTGDKVVGLRLSDLIQPYDLISVYVYKESTPLSELRGTFSADRTTFTPQDGGTAQLEADDLLQESILQSPTDTGTLFSNEFNGFVMRKSFSRRVGTVDTLDVQGNGITRLFGSTRRIIKASLLQDSIYTLREQTDVKAITALQNIFAGSSVLDIFIDLFLFVYGIRIQADRTTVSSGATFNNNQLSVNGSQIRTEIVRPGDSLYDMTTLQVGNARQVNSFNIPPFLLAQVMKRKGFNYREVAGDSFAVRQANLSQLTDIVETQAAEAQSGTRNSESQVLLRNESLQEVDRTLNNPIVFDPELAELRTYFKFLQDVFRFFNPETKTPFEIIDEVKKVTFAEFFERGDGTVHIRAPQYNNQDLMVRSSDLDVIDVRYETTVENLVTKLKLGYAHDFIPSIKTLQEFNYTDGKLLLQYGLLETTSEANPNAKNDKSNDEEVNRNSIGILYRYARFFLKIHNAQLNTGSVTAKLDTSVSIGDTYFDEKNQKFGYIVGISKNVNVGASATMTLQLSYVRDAVQDDPTDPESAVTFELLPTLQNINSES